jgi:hypothetical protein
MDDDRKGRGDHSHLIRNLVNGELRFQTFVDAGGKGLFRHAKLLPAE